MEPTATPTPTAGRPAPREAVLVSAPADPRLVEALRRRRRAELERYCWQARVASP
ncbi:MAG TPA: hypothetical protein VNZ62_13100 [Capillimicrobium sp.]|nr:hypothetical protein [Capillimicrobium sp.]